MYTKRLSIPRAWCAAALVFVGATVANSVLAQSGGDVDPPSRVARIGYLQGNVSFQPAGDDQWAEASLNRPLGTGDKVYSDASSRVELQVGAADVRLDEHSTFTLTNLNDTTAQIELTEGVMNLHVRRAGDGQNIEVDTPTLAFVVNQPGNYRIDIAPQGNSTMVTVFEGGGDVYGENNASYRVRGGNSYRFNDSALHDYEVLDLPRADDFDRWAQSRDARYTRSVSSAYVAEDVVGYADLDDNGSWSDVPEYGHVWYPTTVAVDWAPYRSGHWSWIDPWGWTWVDSASWGFAPFHYGRWAYVGNRWGWCPGERRWGSVYAPALVGFAGGAGWGVGLSLRGGGGPVGWFPLGPRDVYVPWYHASRGYFTNVNVRNSRSITNINITNVYNNYSSGRPIGNVNYAYQRNERAITAVSRETFVGARAVGGARVQVNQNMLRTSQVSSRVGIAPTRASFVAAGAARGRAAPPSAALDRRVIARSAPPAAAVPFASRIQAIQRNDSRPLAGNQLRPAVASRATNPTATAAASRVQVVGRGNAAQPQALPLRGAAATRADAATARSAQQSVRGTPAIPAGRTPVAAPANPGGMRGPDVRNTTAPANAPTTGRGSLPSSRFAPQRRGDAENGAATPGRINTPPSRTSPVVQDARSNPAVRNAPANSPATSRNVQPAASPNARPMQDRSVPDRSATVPTRASPANQQRSAPQAPAREVQQQRDTRQSPVQQQRSMPQPSPVREAPQREIRQAQPQREMQQQRSAPVQQVREAPQREIRQAQPQREMQQQRSAPVQQVREAPQQIRQAPQPQQRQAAPAQREQAPARPQPQERGKNDDDDKKRR